MTESATNDLEEVLAHLDELHDELSEPQRAVLATILARAARSDDDEVTGYYLLGGVIGGSTSVTTPKPSTFGPTLDSVIRGRWD